MKNRLFLCFRPLGIDTEGAHQKLHVIDHPRDCDVQVSKSIVVHKEEKNKKMPAGVLGSASPKFSWQPRSKAGSRKALSRVLRSILFGTSPEIRVGERKNQQITFVQNSESSSIADTEPANRKKGGATNVHQVSSTPCSPRTSSTSSSYTTASPDDDSSKTLKRRAFGRSRSNSFDQKKKPKTTKTNENTYSSKEDIVLYLIILALFATAVWGKVLAVFFTSLCLYVIPVVFNGFYWRPENAVKSPEMETSKEHKRRVIMEGLLERKPIQRALNL